MQHQMPESGVVQVGRVTGIRDHSNRGRLDLAERLQRRLAQAAVPRAVNDGCRHLRSHGDITSQDAEYSTVTSVTSVTSE